MYTLYEITLKSDGSRDIIFKKNHSGIFKKFNKTVFVGNAKTYEEQQKMIEAFEKGAKL